MFNPIVNIVRKDKDVLERTLFSDIKEGDTFFCGSTPIIASGAAHISEDASYQGYLVYDNSVDQNGWFPEDLS